MKKFLSTPIAMYLLKFGVLFSLFYFGTLAIIGLSTPENTYSPFVARYLDYVTPLRSLLLHTSDWLLRITGHSTEWIDDRTLGLLGGQSIRMVYSCVGYGVLSFWVAFVIANDGTVSKKLAWLMGGSMFLCLLNVLRIILLLVLINKGEKLPFGWDHHTAFNVAAYSLIFLMIYKYDKWGEQKKTTSTTA